MQVKIVTNPTPGESPIVMENSRHLYNGSRISFRKKRYMLGGRNENILPRTNLINIPLLNKYPALHDETMTMKIPVKITHRSNPNSLVNCNTSYTNSLINRLKNKGHNKANCIQINISPCSANISKSWLPSLLLTITNICHVLNKIDELSGVVELNKPSLVMITE